MKVEKGDIGVNEMKHKKINQSQVINNGSLVSIPHIATAATTSFFSFFFSS